MSNHDTKLGKGFDLAERFSAKRASLFSWDLRAMLGTDDPGDSPCGSFLRAELLPHRRRR